MARHVALFAAALVAALSVGVVATQAGAFTSNASAASFAHQATITQTILVGKNLATFQKLMRQSKIPMPPGYVIVKRANQCDGGVGDAACMDWTVPAATVTFTDAYSVRGLFYHEMGHVFDMYVLAPTGLRAEFAKIDGRPWHTPDSEERFAQAYNLCALNRVIHRTETSDYYAFRLTPTQHRETCALIRAALSDWKAHPDLQQAGQSLHATAVPTDPATTTN